MRVQSTAPTGAEDLRTVQQFDTGFVLVALANVVADTQPLSQWYPLSTGYKRLNLVSGVNCVFLRHRGIAVGIEAAKPAGTAGAAGPAIAAGAPASPVS